MMKPIRILLVLLVLLAGCSSGDGAAESAGAGDVAADDVTQGALQSTREETVALSGGQAEEQPADDGADGADADAEPPAVEELPDAPAVRPGDRVIKEGTISVEVEAGTFDRAFMAVIAKARSFDGDVVGSSTSTADNGDTFGSVTVRVPVANFEDLVVGVGDIGAVRNRDVGSQDVSAEFTDLESRLRHLKAQERFYLGLFEKADTVQDAISVQQQLDGIQSQIEKAQGRINFLDDRTSFSTLTVELFEPGAGGPLAQEEEPTDRPSLAHYWDTARDAFVNVVGAMLVAGLFLLPLLVPMAVVGALWVARRRVRPPSRTPVTAHEQEELEPAGSDV
jgi:hypothetical protein